MKTKRFLAALIAAIMVLTCINLVAFAALPESAKYDENMDNMTDDIFPDGWSYIRDEVTSAKYNGYRGASGEGDDESLRFCIGSGKGYGYGYLILDSEVLSGETPQDIVGDPKATNGIEIDLGGNEITDETVVYDVDFKVGSDTVWAQLFAPVFKNGSNTLYPLNVTVKAGTVSVNKYEPFANGKADALKGIGEMKPDKWHNIGAVITHSSTNGVNIKIYFDSELVYETDFKDSSYKNGYLSEFLIHGTSTTTSNDKGNVEERYYQRNEYIYIDNFYIGENTAMVTPDFLIKEVIPAGNSEIAVNSDFSVVTNQAISNAADVNNSIWLTAKDGTVVNFANIDNIKTNTDKDTLKGQLSDNLFYSEEYTLNVSPKLVNGAGRNLDAKTFKYTTKSMFPVTASVTYTKSTGTATAGLSFDGSNSKAMKVIMASYDNEGAMVDYDVKDVAAYGNGTSLEVSYLNDETIKIFAVDAIDTANILMEPIIDGGKAKSYKQSNTTISLKEAKTFQQIISVEGTTDSVRGWVVAKIAEKGKENSADLKDYLTFDAVQADDNGAFRFAGRVVKADGEYAYTAVAADSSKNSDSGEVKYILGTDTDLLSLKLNGKSCIRNGNDFYLKLKNTEVSGLLVEFALPYKAILMANGEVLESGASRLNCNDTVELTVRSEIGEEETYNLTVDVEITDQYSDRNENLTVIGGDTKYEGEDVVDPGEWVDETRVFTDVSKNYWAMEAIEALYKKGIVAGKGDGTFAPNALITREEFASMVAKAFGFKQKNLRMGFDDIPSGAWYENAVYALADNDIVSGIERHMFGVGRTITRQDMAVILFRVIEGGSVEKVRDYKTFADQSKISSYALDAVNKMYEAGFVNGFEDGTFRPAEGTTKAMAAYMIYSIMN